MPIYVFATPQYCNWVRCDILKFYCSKASKLNILGKVEWNAYYYYLNGKGNFQNFKTNPWKNTELFHSMIKPEQKSPLLIGPSGPVKWYAMKYFTLKTLNTNSQGKVARQIFGNLPCRSPLKNWNIFFHDMMNEGRQWPWFQLCNHLCFWMNDVLIKRGISKAILVGGFESASLQSCTFKSTS